MQCFSCGQVVEAEAKFCSSCGAKVVNPTEQVTTQTTRGSSNGVFAGTQYIIEQKIAAMRDTFGIKDREGNLLAYVKKKIVSFGPQFWFEAPDGTRLGEMRGKVLTVRPTFEIYDNQGLVAVVKKKVLKLLGSEWWLEGASGNEIARIKGNVTEHDFTIQSASGMQIAQIHKKWVSIRDSYGIEILSQDLDPYIIIAYSVAMDHAEYKHGGGFSVGLGGMTSDL
jgi:uncharacterized protein YxjI